MALKEEQGLGNWEIATAKKLVSEYRRRHRILQREEFATGLRPRKWCKSSTAARREG
jgi:hypothetical protein